MKSKDKYNLQFRPVSLLGLLQVSLALLLHDSALASHASGHRIGAWPRQEEYSRCTPFRPGPGNECEYAAFVASHLSDVLSRRHSCGRLQEPDSPSYASFRDMCMDRATGCRRPEPLVGCWPCRPPHGMSPWMSCELQEVRWWLRVCVSRCKRSRSITVMKDETACSASQSQLIMAGYTIRALLLRLHSPHKSPPCKGAATHQ